MKNLTIFFFVLACYQVVAQSGEILVSGSVREVASGKGVKAKIVYKSIPTGSITGFFNDSTYRFSVFGSSKYQITVTAENYLPRAILIDPSNTGGTGTIIKDVVLTPRGQTIRLEHLLFEVGKSDIDPTSFDELDDIAALLTENPKMVVQLEGHTDNMGNVQSNMKLSQERVDALKKYLVSKKVNKNQVKTKAFGGTQPISKGKTPEEREKNRRVEMRVLSEN
jgi:outer membrane protein OmpA-like peptidoglycan-associated protein